MESKKTSIAELIKIKGYEDIWLKRFSFTNILVCSNMMQTMFSKTQDGITSKQWLLLTIASHAEDEPYTLSEIGTIMGCSRQNVKQIANVLNKNGYLNFTKIDGDKNAMRILPTKKWFDYCKQNEEVTSNILEEIFKDFSNDELKSYFESFLKVISNIEKINKELKER